MSANPLQGAILDLFEQTRQEISAFIADVSNSEKTNGTPDHYSAKDILANIAFWQNYMVERMEFYAHGKTPPREVDFDKLSADAYMSSQNDSWNAVVANGNNALNKLTKTVSHFSDADLSINNAYGDSPGGPLWGEVIANGYLVAMHAIEEFHMKRHHLAEAEAARERSTQQNRYFNRFRSLENLISTDTLHGQQHATPSTFVIDVRSAEEYAGGHISGAVNIPFEQLPDQISKIPADQEIVTYCNMHHPGESRSERATTLLRENGYDANTLNGGFPAWKAADLPVKTGSSI